MCSGPAATSRWATSTYAGITGKGAYDGTQLETAADGMDHFLTDVELDFQLKPPTQ